MTLIWKRSDKIGELKLKEFLQRAENELRSEFDVREFNDAVLLDGCLPLDVLEEQINAWIERKKLDRKRPHA